VNNYSGFDCFSQADLVRKDVAPPSIIQYGPGHKRLVRMKIDPSRKQSGKSAALAKVLDLSSTKSLAIAKLYQMMDLADCQVRTRRGQRKRRRRFELIF
jgi:hypothetical protein